MKQIYTFLAGTLLLLSSCSSSRKAAQTPDDVYYSPASNKTAAAAGDDPEYYSAGRAQQGDYYSTAPNDQYVRLKVQDPARWSYFDDYSSYDSYYSPGISSAYGYGYSAYGYGMGFGFGPSFGLGFGDPYMCWNSYFMWNSWYNPYFYNPYYGGGVLVVGGSKYGSTAVYSHLRTFNGSAYSNGLATRSVGSNDRAYRPRTAPTYYTPGNRTGQYTTNSNGNNNYYRSSNSNNSNNNTYSRPSSQPSYSQPVRTYSAPSGGGGGFSRPGRH